VNFEILKGKDRQNCMCTAMLMDPADKTGSQPAKVFNKKSKLYERFMRIKKALMLQKKKK
jgi:hypothetical protein